MKTEILNVKVNMFCMDESYKTFITKMTLVFTLCQN
jgi:hypothetical protein